MQTITFKTSIIFVATGKRTRVFQSLDDVPPRLRDQMSDNLSGPHTRTLIVADRRGRDYLLKALRQGAEAPIAVRSAEALYAGPSVARHRLLTVWRIAERHRMEVGMVSLLGLAGWGLALLT